MSRHVFLGLGSNRNRDQNLRIAICQLKSTFACIRISPVYASAPNHFPAVSNGDCDQFRYFNLVVEFKTALSASAIKSRLREIERLCGRIQGGSEALSCPLDIDILLYGDIVGQVDGFTFPHPDVDSRAYVLLPLSQIAPTLMHPRLNRSFAELWQIFGNPPQSLQKVFLMD